MESKAQATEQAELCACGPGASSGHAGLRFQRPEPEIRERRPGTESAGPGVK